MDTKEIDIRVIVNNFINKIQQMKMDIKQNIPKGLSIEYPDKSIALVIKNFNQYCLLLGLENNKTNYNNYNRLIKELNTYSHNKKQRGLIIHPHVEDYGVVVKHDNTIIVSVSGNEFDFIYKTQRWSQDPATKNLPPITKILSGEGSDISTSRKTINFITGITKEYKINSILDLSCGDMNYMRETLYNIRKTNPIKYTRMDISIVCLENNSKQYCGNSITQPTVDDKFTYTNNYINGESTEYIQKSNEMSRDFRCINDTDLSNLYEGSMLVKDDLKKIEQKLDSKDNILIIVREVFQHIYYNDVNTALKNILEVFDNCYFLATNYINNDEYCNGFMTLTGGTQIRNLSLHPIVPQLPLTRNFDDQYRLNLYPRKPDEPGYHYMSLWKISNGEFLSVD